MTVVPPHRQPLSRRKLLGIAGAGATVSLIGAAPAAAADPVTVAGQTLVSAPADPDFVFTADLSDTTGAGEAAPIGSPYWLGAYQVSNAQYAAFLGTDAGTGHTVPSYWDDGTVPAGKEQHPVLTVALADAEGFCDWLTGQAAGWTFRLPTEAEWESAARGPGSYAYPWGPAAGTTYTDSVLTSRYNYNAVCAAHYLADHGSTEATYDEPESTRYGESEPISEILTVSATGGVTGWIHHDTWTGFVYTDVFDALMATGGLTSPWARTRTASAGTAPTTWRATASNGPPASSPPPTARRPARTSTPYAAAPGTRPSAAAPPTTAARDATAAAAIRRWASGSPPTGAERCGPRERSSPSRREAVPRDPAHRHGRPGRHVPGGPPVTGTPRTAAAGTSTAGGSLPERPAGRPSARDLTARDLTARDLAVRDLAGRDLAVRDHEGRHHALVLVL
nr:formylglycine-generating enzyme family protein [Streptomyces humi]